MLSLEAEISPARSLFLSTLDKREVKIERAFPEIRNRIFKDSMPIQMEEVQNMLWIINFSKVAENLDKVFESIQKCGGAFER